MTSAAITYARRILARLGHSDEDPDALGEWLREEAIRDEEHKRYMADVHANAALDAEKSARSPR